MNIALIGYGKMGKVIERIAKERGHSIGLIIDQDNLNDLNEENLQNIDVAIEFSTPEVAVANYKCCFQYNMPVVSGTTGWLQHKSEVEEECAKGARFFYASNFSLGVNLFFAKSLKITVRALKKRIIRKNLMPQVVQQLRLPKEFWKRILIWKIGKTPQPTSLIFCQLSQKERGKWLEIIA